MKELKLEVDPERVKALQKFQQIEPKIFETSQDQKKAHQNYDKAINSALLQTHNLAHTNQERTATLTPGTIVQNGSVIHFPASLINLS